MTEKDGLFEPATVFISYWHLDESLKDDLEKHLSALKRSGLVSTWTDRRIGPGKEWKKEIDNNLFRADLFLLLISADFLASDFCYLVETQNAIERHKRGEAIVIPIVLRDVDFRGLPISDLQMLPKDAHPVTSSYWESEDEAFKNISEGLRIAIESLPDLRRRAVDVRERPGTVTEPRALDAAIGSEIPTGVIHEVAVQVRLVESKGLRGVLADMNIGSDYSSQALNVRSEQFRARFGSPATGQFVSPEYLLSVYAPDLVNQDAEKKFILEPMHDSSVFKFFVKAENEGEHRLRVNLFAKDWQIAEVVLKTAAKGPAPAPKGGGIGRLLASVELVVRAVGRAASGTA